MRFTIPLSDLGWLLIPFVTLLAVVIFGGHSNERWDAAMFAYCLGIGILIGKRSMARDIIAITKGDKQ